MAHYSQKSKRGTIPCVFLWPQVHRHELSQHLSYSQHAPNDWIVAYSNWYTQKGSTLPLCQEERWLLEAFVPNTFRTKKDHLRGSTSTGNKLSLSCVATDLWFCSTHQTIVLVLSLTLEDKPLIVCKSLVQVSSANLQLNGHHALGSGNQKFVHHSGLGGARRRATKQPEREKRVAVGLNENHSIHSHSQAVMELQGCYQVYANMRADNYRHVNFLGQFFHRNPLAWHDCRPVCSKGPFVLTHCTRTNSALLLTTKNNTNCRSPYS